MTKVEQVARAIYGTTALSQTTPQWENVRYELKDLFLRQAQVAIAAMREPTEAMEDAATGYEDACLGDWRRMIDAALAEKPV